MYACLLWKSGNKNIVISQIVKDKQVTIFYKNIFELKHDYGKIKNKTHWATEWQKISSANVVLTIYVKH